MRDALILAALLACYGVASEMDYREAQRQAAEAAARRGAVGITDPEAPPVMSALHDPHHLAYHFHP